MLREIDWLMNEHPDPKRFGSSSQADLAACPTHPMPVRLGGERSPPGSKWFPRLPTWDFMGLPRQIPPRPFPYGGRSESGFRRRHQCPEHRKNRKVFHEKPPE